MKKKKLHNKTSIISWVMRTMLITLLLSFFVGCITSDIKKIDFRTEPIDDFDVDSFIWGDYTSLDNTFNGNRDKLRLVLYRNDIMM